MIYLRGIDWRRKRLSIVTFWADKKEETLPEHRLKQRESRKATAGVKSVLSRTPPRVRRAFRVSCTGVILKGGKRF